MSHLTAAGMGFPLGGAMKSTLRLVRRLSIKTKLIFSYLVILAVGNLGVSLVGSSIVSSTIMRQAQRTAEQNLATARTIYQEELQKLQRAMELAAMGTTIQEALRTSNPEAVRSYLEGIRTREGFDFLTLTDELGRALVRSTPSDRLGGPASDMRVVRAALSGEPAAGTEILPPDLLAREDPSLPARARIRIVPTPRARPSEAIEEASGMALVAAAPVWDGDRCLGALYGGILLNRNLAIVDRIWEVLYQGEFYRGQKVGTVTVFQGDTRVATTVETAEGTRALGTRVSEEVRNAVLDRGEAWNDRAFVVRDWYISSYETIRDYEGDIVGILYVGILEKRYTAIRDRVILSFFVFASIGFVLIIAVTYGMIRNVTRPLTEIAGAARHIAAGDFDQRVDSEESGEIGLLADSFNTMASSLRQMKSDLEGWGHTLEQKVEERTRELINMQARVAQSERLASVGMLAAGVAHEINNPLGGVLALTALTLEDLPEDDPNRPNLEEVVNQAERCKEIVRGLLDFSRQSEVSAEPVHLNMVLEETLDLVRKQAAFFNVELVRAYESGLPPVMANKSELQQVFLNIVMNGAQAMGERGGTLTVATRRTADGYAEVAVSDTGHGIPADHVEHIFDPFFTTKPGGRGTGLGLSIAYGIVTRHRGTISVESHPGRGSTFTIRLPCAPTFAGPAYERSST